MPVYTEYVRVRWRFAEVPGKVARKRNKERSSSGILSGQRHIRAHIYAQHTKHAEFYKVESRCDEIKLRKTEEGV